MSRLDDEYDPAETHDLAFIDRQPVSGDRRRYYGWICACGASSASYRWKTRRGARAAHDQHRERAA